MFGVERDKGVEVLRAVLETTIGFAKKKIEL